MRRSASQIPADCNVSSGDCCVGDQLNSICVNHSISATRESHIAALRDVAIQLDELCCGREAPCAGGGGREPVSAAGCCGAVKQTGIVHDSGTGRERSGGAVTDLERAGVDRRCAGVGIVAAEGEGSSAGFGDTPFVCCIEIYDA